MVGGGLGFLIDSITTNAIGDTAGDVFIVPARSQDPFSPERSCFSRRGVLTPLFVMEAEPMPYEKKDFQQEYSEDEVLEKIRKYAKTAGLEVLERALRLYYAAHRPETPAWAKAVIFGALGYFISPVDAIPDVTPVVGFADDLGVLAAAMGAVAVFVDSLVKEKAAEKLNE